ncbi:WecB/TagA/CpsF family glycosyltransferase [Rhodococcus jostii]|nr:WecB/TagA/CpsF family glycosyltransferase [Rhodococcus jostii]
MLSGGFNLPDGLPVVWYMMRSNRRAPELVVDRHRGPSFFYECLDRGREFGTRHFLLGATEETIALLADRLKSKYPGLAISGTWAPPFAPLDDGFFTKAAELIRASQPDIVWVAMGTPKQDFAALRISTLTGIDSVGVGAAFDFGAGTVAEAPKLIQDSGFEWLYRLCCEPRRLWKRYFFGNVRFLFHAEVALVRDRITSLVCKIRTRRGGLRGANVDGQVPK